MKRHVFLVGPRKTGTSAFYDILCRRNARICRFVKESYFFAQEAPDLAKYADRFGLDPAVPFIEVSPSYFAEQTAKDNLRALFPEAIIVITLRHPADRFISAVKHANVIGLRKSFEGIENEDNFRTAKTNSDYETHVADWAERFPGRVLVLKQVAPGRYSPRGYAALREVLGQDIPDAEFLAQRSNEAFASRSPLLTRLLRRAIEFLRRYGGHRMAKALVWAKPLFFRRRRDDEAAIDRAAVERVLAREIAFFEALPDCQFR